MMIAGGCRAHDEVDVGGSDPGSIECALACGDRKLVKGLRGADATLTDACAGGNPFV